MSDSDDQEKTRIQPPRKPGTQAENEESATDGSEIVGDKEAADDTTIFMKRAQPAPIINAELDNSRSVKTERADSDLEEPLKKTRVQQRISNTDPTEASGQELLKKKPRRSRLQAQDTLKNRFVLGRVLGAGGMGVVYKAKDLLKVEAKDRDPFVAIKVLGEEFKSHPEAFIALQRESRKTQKIAHPNIVNVYDFDKDGDTVFMTMEFMDGAPLDKLIKKYKSSCIPRADAWEILDGICAALAYAHDQKIIHSDLKPGNIFVTSNNVSKVFDFGIARAVAKAEQHDTDGDAEDKTIFDAGNLGALTPAYASLEMLEGHSPDIRDDIYALGCIAYELFAGQHPFQRKNAREANSSGLKPEKINGISKQQWRAIERALAFEREDRVESVKEFWSLLTLERTLPYKTWLFLVVVAALSGFIVYSSVFKAVPTPQFQRSAEDVANEAEKKVRMEIAEMTLKGLLDNPVFDLRWERELWQALQGFTELVGADDERVVNVGVQAYQLYLSQIEKDVMERRYSIAEKHIANGYRYTQDAIDLKRFEAMVAEGKAEVERMRLAEMGKMAEKKAKNRIAQEKRKEEVRKRKAYDLALANISEQLECKKSLNMDNFSIAVAELKKINGAFYKKSEPKIVSGLVTCITQIGRNFPSRAEAARTKALVIFEGNPALQRLTVKAKDSCTERLAGQGARGKRSICRDALSTGGKGPRLIVIPAKGNMKAFAIGKYEITREDMNHYCSSVGSCDSFAANKALPATNFTFKQAKAYMTWLGKETGNTYRLPTHTEWAHAAKAKNQGLYSNRNCKLNSRGIRKGGALVNAEVGQKNGWGMVNHIGNAQEWVMGRGNKLWVVGGSYNTQMEECTLDWQKSSKGAAEPETGFRVIRELKVKS